MKRRLRSASMLNTQMGKGNAKLTFDVLCRELLARLHGRQKCDQLLHRVDGSCLTRWGDRCHAGSFRG
jgi:hypothetical protein